MERVAARAKEALEAADLDAYAGLLDPSVRWGAPGDPVPPCRNRDQVLGWYRRAREAGASARVTETVVSGNKILLGLRLAGGRGAGGLRWQVLTVDAGLITAITGFGERDEAAAWAGLKPEPPAPPDAIRCTAPRSRLADEQVELRRPEPADAAVLHAYVSRPGGLDGEWVPLPGDASLEDCRALVDDWRAGWENRRSFHGPALIITAARSAAGAGLSGIVGLGDRGGRVVELAYGVAPDRRGRGFATRAVRLAAHWLLEEGYADVVELRIDPANTVSQRVAATAGFTPDRTNRPPRSGAGDLRFVMRPDR